MLFAAISASATFSHLCFTTTGGTEHHLRISGMAISLSETTISASHSEGTLELDLTELQSLKFTDGTSSAIGITTETDGITTIYRLDGTVAGTFGSATEAVESLPSGIYLIHDSNGSATKITIKK